mgnify:CR=1 FL=1
MSHKNNSKNKKSQYASQKTKLAISESPSESTSESSPDQMINHPKNKDNGNVLDWEIFDEMGLTQSSTYTDSVSERLTADSYSDSYGSYNESTSEKITPFHSFIP